MYVVNVVLKSNKCSVETAMCVHETQFTIIPTHTGNSDTGFSIIPTQLGDGAIQQLKEKLLAWKEWVQKRTKEQDEKTSNLAMETRMSRAKSHEISKLKKDLEQAVQEKEVQNIYTLIFCMHALCYHQAYV